MLQCRKKCRTLFSLKWKRRNLFYASNTIIYKRALATVPLLSSPSVRVRWESIPPSGLVAPKATRRARGKAPSTPPEAVFDKDNNDNDGSIIGRGKHSTSVTLEPSSIQGLTTILTLIFERWHKYFAEQISLQEVAWIPPPGCLCLGDKYALQCTYLQKCAILLHKR